MSTARLRICDPPWLRLGRRASALFLVVGCTLLLVWQLGFIAKAGPRIPAARPSPDGELDARFARSGLQGLYHVDVQRFFYFLYYTGHFPISSRRPLAWNREAAEAALEDGPFLIMERASYLRTGDLAKIFLLYPDAWLRGTPRGATLFTFNHILGIGSLLAVFVSFSLLDHRLLGSLLALLLGSHPHQLAELYMHNNVFGHAIPVLALALALCAPLLLRPAGRRPAAYRFPLVLWLPLLSGAWLATVREVRSEPALAILSVATVLVFRVPGAARKAALLGALVGAFAATSAAWGQYWERRFEEAYDIVDRAGGETYDGPRNRHHAFWHAIWCGLGDFGGDRGYVWDDREAFRYGIPEVNRLHGTDYRLVEGAYFLADFHTPAHKHRIRPETLPEYSAVLRDRVLSDVRDDPLWYAGILARRTRRLLSEAPPVRLGLGSRTLDLPFSAWLWPPACLVLALLRRWDQLLLLGFLLPASLPALLVYSGAGLAFGSAFHHVLFAMAACWIANALPAGRAGTAAPA